MVAKSIGQQGKKGHGFAKGTSGNPSGRPAGSRNKVTILAQTLLDGEAEALVRKVIDQALGGDSLCLRACLERLVPPRKDAPVSVVLPKVAGAQDLPKATQAILAAVAEGELTPGEAQAIAGIVADHRKNLELCDLEARVAMLEDRPLKERNYEPA
jgi:hypothetical protein